MGFRKWAKKKAKKITGHNILSDKTMNVVTAAALGAATGGIGAVAAGATAAALGAATTGAICSAVATATDKSGATHVAFDTNVYDSVNSSSRAIAASSQAPVPTGNEPMVNAQDHIAIASEVIQVTEVPEVVTQHNLLQAPVHVIQANDLPSVNNNNGNVKSPADAPQTSFLNRVSSIIVRQNQQADNVNLTECQSGARSAFLQNSCIDGIAHALIGNNTYGDVAHEKMTEATDQLFDAHLEECQRRQAERDQPQQD